MWFTVNELILVPLLLLSRRPQRYSTVSKIYSITLYSNTTTVTYVLRYGIAKSQRGDTVMLAEMSIILLSSSATVELLCRTVSPCLISFRSKAGIPDSLIGG